MRRPHHRSAYAIAMAAGGVAAALLAGATPAYAAGPVAGTVSVGKGGSLAVRADPSPASAMVKRLSNGSRVTVVCQVDGTYVKGRVRKTAKWDRLANGQYVTDAYVKRDTKVVVPACPKDAPQPLTLPTPLSPDEDILVPRVVTPPAPAWTQPVPQVRPGGFRTLARPTHDGVDLSHPRNTPIVAAAAGTVVTVRCNASTPSCDVDGSMTTTGCGWYVEILHEADILTRYCHLVRQPEVKVGDEVTTGQLIGYVGTSGHSSGPHLHFEVHVGYPANRANAIDPLPFMRFVGAPLG